MILRDTTASVPRTRSSAESARLPEFVDSQPPLHFSFLIMLGLVVFVWFVLQRTTNGFEIRMVGANPNAARYAGVNVKRVIVVVMAMSARSPGLAGAGEITGTHGFLSPGAFVAIGFDSIAIALLARANPFAIVPARSCGARCCRRAADAAGDRPVDRHRADRAGAHPAVRRGGRDRAHDLPHPQPRSGALEEAQLGTTWGATA